MRRVSARLHLLVICQPVSRKMEMGSKGTVLYGQYRALDRGRRSSPRGRPAQGTVLDGQYRAQGSVVHQAQEEVEVGEVLPGGGVFEVFPAQVDVMGAIVILGRGRGVWWCRPAQGQAVP